MDMDEEDGDDYHSHEFLQNNSFDDNDFEEDIQSSDNVADDLENAISTVKWSTIDIPLINFNHFNVLDVVYFDKEEQKDNIDFCEKKKPANKGVLKSLREGIKNGSIVKEMQPDGSYIWKRVRK